MSYPAQIIRFSQKNRFSFGIEKNLDIRIFTHGVMVPSAPFATGELIAVFTSVKAARFFAEKLNANLDMVSIFVKANEKQAKRVIR